MATWVQESGGNMVAVNIQYRLGLLGFLASSVLMQNGSANVGLLDQRAATEWVQRYGHVSCFEQRCSHSASHIGAFGGDPNHITVSGESAVCPSGISSCALLIVSYKARQTLSTNWSPTAAKASCPSKQR